MKKHALIAGGAGFLGSHLSDLLLAKEFRVTVLDNLCTGNCRNIAHLNDNSDFRFIEHDICTPISIDDSIDYIFNLASPASPRDYHNMPLDTMRVGSVGTMNLLELAKAKGARFLMASTSECYGDPEVHPQVESYWGNVNPIGPRSVYDEAKRFSEAATMAYHREFGLETRIIRIFNTYGPRMALEDGRALPNFFCQALRNEPLTVYGNGSQTRSFCYVDDLLRGMYLLMMSDETMPVNIGNSQEVTLLEVAKEVIGISGSSSEIIYQDLPENDPKVRQPDTTRAQEILGWQAEIPRSVGLQKTLAYFREAITACKEQG